MPPTQLNIFSNSGLHTVVRDVKEALNQAVIRRAGGVICTAISSFPASFFSRFKIASICTVSFHGPWMGFVPHRRIQAILNGF